MSPGVRQATRKYTEVKARLFILKMRTNFGYLYMGDQTWLHRTLLYVSSCWAATSSEATLHTSI